MMKKKRAVTLLEMMVVIFLIGIITTVIGFNMRGSLEEGKAFKSKQGAERLADILNLQIAKSTEWSAKNLIENKGEVERCLKNSKLVKNVEEFLKDGWGEGYKITVEENEENVVVVSEKLEKYEAKKREKEPSQPPSPEEEKNSGKKKGKKNT